MTENPKAMELVSRPLGSWVEVSVVDAAGDPVTRGAFLHALVSDADARARLARCLAEAPYRALFFEMPPLARSRLDAAAEFVLVDAPPLLRMRPDPRPFEEHLRDPGPSVRRFENKSGDAILIAPRADGPSSTYLHVAAFCRAAPPEQCDLLWRSVAESALEHVEQRDAPLWVSTSGLGVGWLHVRLDSWPKYYSHRQYRDPAA